MMEDIFDYYKEQTILLSYSINKKTKIYLDTNYWVDICDVTLGKKKNNSIKEIYTLLKKGVEENRIICPISYPVFVEVLKQNDEQTLYQTTKIIDELSQGYILREERQRFELELFNFFYDNLKMEVDITASQNYWDYVYNVYGFMIPTYQKLSLVKNLSIQKQYFNDIVKKHTLSDMVKEQNFKQKLSHYKNYKIDTDWFMSKKIEHSQDHNTFHQLYMAELYGLLDVYSEDIQIIFQKVIEDKAKQENIINLPNNKVNNDVAKNMIYNIFDQKKMGSYLPTIDISTILHAKLRWNKTQKYKQGDFNDIAHATSALPYYDYFFTEGNLHTMIQQSNYDKKYNCIVYSKYTDVLILLKQMA